MDWVPPSGKAKPSQHEAAEKREREDGCAGAGACACACVRANGSRRSGPMRCGAANTRADWELGKRMEARFGSRDDVRGQAKTRLPRRFASPVTGSHAVDRIAIMKRARHRRIKEKQQFKWCCCWWWWCWS